MDATATPRGISLAVGELGARGRPTFYMTSRTAVSVNRIRSLRPSTVFVDVCPRDTHTPHGLFCFPTHPPYFVCAVAFWGWSCNGVSCGAVVCCRARVAGVRVEGTFSPPLLLTMLWNL